MNICDDDHEEIVFVGRVCPMCDLFNTIDDLENTVETMQSEIDSLT